MAKFRVTTNSGMPFHGQEYEGDYMKSEKQFVRIFKKIGKEEREVASIHLDKGQSVIMVDERERR
jgi:hypothetical protein